ncbi:hypothetical protein K488DRAFT_70178 [Vararia minispora EC-137]|uniref:Uncharacterized protein n=1 Tax=Vararia minispora EC-137 TaxID=1314806 RepID=A0ACB8QN11_9AGAM|nr:hypothetical protein K488DRAFT_70178 [Vararia minispora EC-137]
MSSKAGKGKKRARANSEDDLQYEEPTAPSASTISAATLDGPSQPVDLPQSSRSITPINNTATTQSVDNASLLAVDIPECAANADEALAMPDRDGLDSEGIETCTEMDPITPLIVKDDHLLDEDTLKRIRSLAVYVDAEMAVFAPRKIPGGLQWNSSSLKNSKLILAGKETPVSLWIVGRVNWNGMIPKPSSSSSPGVAFISIDPVVKGDLSKLRDLVTRYSSNGSTADAMTSVRASRMMSYRERNNPDMQVDTFRHVFDARDGKVDISDMDVLDPSFVMQHDLVLIEVSLGRFRDTKTKDWTKFRLSLELDAVYVLAQAPNASLSERSPLKKMRRII